MIDIESIRNRGGFEAPEDVSLEIVMDGVRFSYGTSPILKGIELRIDRSELVSIIGPNGVGKSTLIRCMNKILRPTEGSVTVNGTDVGQIAERELAKVLGYVPCASTGTFPITVVDAVLMGRYPHQRYGSLERDLEIVYETLERLDIGDLAMRSLNELSAGQHQKVMVAKGLAQTPKVLLLDEPTANLDIRHQLNVTRLLRDLSREEDMAVVMICHDLNIASKYSDRIILMHEGRIFATGTPEEVITEENLMTVYGVKSRVVRDLGRPHVMLRDDEDPRSGGGVSSRSPRHGVSRRPSPRRPRRCSPR